MTTDPRPPRTRSARRLPGVLLVILSAVLAARSPAWAAAVGTATAVYTVIAPDNQGPRS